MRYTWAECREFLGDDGHVVGTIITFSYAEETWNIVLIHDWSREGAKYVPICVGHYENIVEGERLIEMAARNAQAPDTFHFVPIEGGRTWEWEHGDLTYQAVSLNGSPNVMVYAHSTSDPDEWEFKFKRPTNGLGAQGIAEKICSDVMSGKADDDGSQS